MKNVIAIAAILASTQTFAFFDQGNSAGTFVQNGKADATGKGEATFGMAFEGNGSTNGNTVFRGDDNKDTGSATGFTDNSGSAKFSFNFSARAEGNGDMTNSVNGQTGFASEQTPYYYGK